VHLGEFILEFRVDFGRFYGLFGCGCFGHDASLLSSIQGSTMGAWIFTNHVSTT